MSIESVIPSNHLILCGPLLLPSVFPASRSFPVNQFCTSGSQSIGVSASTSVLPVNVQTGFPLGWTDWISLQSKGLSESSPTPQFRGSCTTWCGRVGQGKRPQALKILRQVSNQLLWIPLSCEEWDLPPWCPCLLLYLSLPHPQMKPPRGC